MMTPADFDDEPRTLPAGASTPRGWFRRWLDSLEKMSSTRANNRVSMVLDIVMPVVLLSAAVWSGHLHSLPALALVLAGLLLFSFIEYVFHRWIFHGDRTLDAFRKGHGNHHVDPLVDAALPFFLPPVIVLLLTALMALAMPWGYAALLIGTVAFGYACYDWSHYIIHIRRFRQPLLRDWAAFHHIHHHHPETNFGVTSPLWDYLLGTRYIRTSNARRRA